MAITLKISDQHRKPFSFKLNGKVLTPMLDKLLLVSGFISASSAMRRHLFVSYRKKLYLVGYSTDTFISIDTGAKTKIDGGFNFEPDQLKGLIKNKGDLLFKYNGSSSLDISVHEGKYKATLKPSPITVDQMPQVQQYFGKPSEKTNALPSEVLTKLKTGVSRTQVFDHFNDSAPSPITVLYGQEDKKLLQVFTMSGWAGAMYEASTEKAHKPFKMVISPQVFSLVSKVLGDSEEDVDFFFQDENFRVETPELIVGLPPMQDTTNNDYKLFQSYLKSMEALDKKGKTSGRIRLNFSDVNPLMQNVMVLATENQMRMTIKAEKNKCAFSVAHDGGSVSDILNGTGPLKPETKPKRGTKKPQPVEHFVPFEGDCYPRIFIDAMSNIKGGDFILSVYKKSPSIRMNLFSLKSESKGESLHQFLALLSDVAR